MESWPEQGILFCSTWWCMTEKELMAVNYSNSINPTWNASLESKKAYLAGFNKAIEMMLKRNFITEFESHWTKNLGEKEI